MTNKKLLIYSDMSCHYEIIESIIVKYSEIIKVDIKCDIYIFFDYQTTINTVAFKKYINDTYPSIKFTNISDYSYIINISMYIQQYKSLCDTSGKLPKTYFGIAHRVDEVLLKDPNIYYLTDLSKKQIFEATILPFANNKVIKDYPIFIVQGLDPNRRDYEIFIKLINHTTRFPFKFKLLGKANFNLDIVKHVIDRIILKTDLNFIDFHKEFSDAYCLCTMISKSHNPDYYTKSLSSSINYIKGYNLKGFLDDELQNIYNLSNAVTYKPDYSNLANQFERVLEEFYNSKHICGVYIEPRDLMQIYKNIENFNNIIPGSKLYFFCGKGLLNHYKTTITHKNVVIIELDTVNFDFSSYSNFMKSSTFWNNIDETYTHMITIQSDGCLCENSGFSIWDFIHYDYVGGYAKEGWWWKETQGLHYKNDYQCFNGGFSLRNIKASKDVLRNFPSQHTEKYYQGCPINYYPEDLYFTAGMLKLGYNVGTDKYAINFCSHTSFVDKCFSIHKLNKYVENNELKSALDYCPEFAFFM